MKILITGSAGHLGEALLRSLQKTGDQALGLDILASPFTRAVGSIADRGFVKRSMAGIDAVIHTATLHKPHVATHSYQDFIETNITGTLNLLEEAAAANVKAFVFTSTTSAFGSALTPGPELPAAWVTEETRSVPKNIYGLTKKAAEELCQLFQRKQGLPCLVLRTSRFFPEEDDNRDMRQSYADGNAKANEFLFRRVDIADAVSAHLLALRQAPEIGFGTYIISATTPFLPADMAGLRADARQVLLRRQPDFADEYARRGWQMFPDLDRVYDNEKARRDLGWIPEFDFNRILGQLKANEPPGSALSRLVGAKGYHDQVFTEGPYLVE